MIIKEVGRIESGSVLVPIGSKTNKRLVPIELSEQELSQQMVDPLGDALGRPYWIYRNKLLLVSEDMALSPEEVKTRIKHFVLSNDNKFKRIQKEIEEFEKFENQPNIKREKISESVRYLVWRRDEGKCVSCNSKVNLEFDHIIPVAEGGSNTDRNIQLLCERCNRSKGRKI